MTPYHGLSIGRDGDFAIAVVDDADVPAEGYRVEPLGGQHWAVHAHDVLGAQYGVAAALENLGDPVSPSVSTPTCRSSRPTRARRARRTSPRSASAASSSTRSIRSRRTGRSGSRRQTTPADAHRIINWVIANRGNYLQWVALDDLITVAGHRDAWQPYARELIDYAHSRGVRVGLEIELFGQSNLQHAFDLSDDTIGHRAARRRGRAAPAAGHPGPAVRRLRPELRRVLQRRAPDVHRREQRGREAAPRARPAGRAPRAGPRRREPARRLHGPGPDLLLPGQVRRSVDHPRHPHRVCSTTCSSPPAARTTTTDFSEHRAVPARADVRAVRRPRTTPRTRTGSRSTTRCRSMFPLYVRSRWLDLHRARGRRARAAPLDEHLLFSTGWEWGYWLHDVTSMRDSYELPAPFQDTIVDELAPRSRARVPARWSPRSPTLSTTT